MINIDKQSLAHFHLHFFRQLVIFIKMQFCHSKLFLSECKCRWLTNWKQLRTEGSMLEPPKEATSPSWRGIWMESWRRRPRRRWSQKPVALATCLNKTGMRGMAGVRAESRESRDRAETWKQFRKRKEGEFCLVLILLFLLLMQHEHFKEPGVGFAS